MTSSFLRFLRPAAAVSLLLAASCSTAAPTDGNWARGAGWYVKANGGLGTLFDGDLAKDGTSGDGSYDSGFQSGGAFGYRYDERLSAEVDFQYRTNDIDSFAAGGSTVTNDGDYASTAVAVSGIWRFRPEQRLRPYIGAGLAYITEIDVDFVDSGTGQEATYEDDGFGAQLMAGVEYGLGGGWDLYAEARYLQAFGFDLESETTPGGTADGDYRHLGFNLGVIYSW